MKGMAKGLAALIGGLTLLTLAGRPALAADPVDAPPPPEVLESGEPLEPEVTIREQGAETIYEYRVDGKLVMVRVQPKGAPPYYFVDRDGDGELEFTRDDPREGPNTNMWVLFRW